VLVEESVSHFGLEQVHTHFEIGRDTVDDGNVFLHFVVHDIKVLQVGLKNVLFKIVTAVSKSVVHERDEKVFLDEVDVEIAKLLARIACNGIAQIGDTIVLVGGDDEFSGIDFVGAIGQHGYIRVFVDMELLHFFKIDVVGDIRVGYDDVFFLIVHQISAKMIQRFDFALVHFVFVVENERREKSESAVFSVQVPVSAHAEMIHKRVVVASCYDAYRRDVCMNEI